eukprot:267397_1
MSVFSIFTIFLLILLIFQLCCSKESQTILRFYRYITIISSLSIGLCIVLDLAHIVWCFSMDDVLISRTYSIVIILSDILYYIGDIALYVLLISRVYFTFHDTVYAITKPTIALFAMLISIFTLAAIYFCFIIFCFMIGIIKDLSAEAQYNEPVAIILDISDLLLNVSLIALFLFKLKQLTASIYDIDNPELHSSFLSDNGESKKVSIQINSKQSRLIMLISKHTVLGSLVVVANQFWWIGYIVVNDIWHKSSLNQYSGLIYVMRGIENFINILVMYLSLKINNFIYNKLCFICDHCCYQCVVQDTKQTVAAITMNDMVL